MLEQVRKYKIGLILAHQTLAQLTSKLKASLMANTGTKLVSGMSFGDAKAMAQELGCTPEFLQSMRKTDTTTSFALWIKNQTPNAREVTVQLGAVNELPKLPPESYEQLMGQNRERYCQRVALSEQGETTKNTESEIQPDIEASETTNSTSLTHLEIQRMIRDAAHAQNFHVTLEKLTPDGAGRINVVLERREQSIAIEIGRTTRIEHEVRNIRKCLAAGYRQVWHISDFDERRRTMRSKAIETFSSAEITLIAFMTVEEVASQLGSLAPVETARSDVRGYEVTVELLPKLSEQAGNRRHRISQLLRNYQPIPR